MKRLIVGISGASGTIYGVRLLEVLKEVADIETHLVMSNAAKRMSLCAHGYEIFEAATGETHHHQRFP